MPNVKSVKPTKTLKAMKPDPAEKPQEQKQEPKKRGRAKKIPPTREEKLKLLQDEAEEIRRNLTDLREDEGKLASIPCKLVHHLVKEEIEELALDLENIERERDNILAQPEE